MSAAPALGRAQREGARLVAKPDGRLLVLERVEDVAPDQLARLRAHKDELAPVLAAYGEARVLIRPATVLAPARVPPPPYPADWRDLDGWRRCFRTARFVLPKREVVQRWAEAAGGTMQGDGIRLPVGLPRCLALAELKANAAMVGFGVMIQS